jgi:hypothetical protein
VSETCRVGSHPARGRSRRLAKTSSREDERMCPRRAVQWFQLPLNAELAGVAVMVGLMMIKVDTDIPGRDQIQIHPPRLIGKMRAGISRAALRRLQAGGQKPVVVGPAGGGEGFVILGAE